MSLFQRICAPPSARKNPATLFVDWRDGSMDGWSYGSSRKFPYKVQVRRYSGMNLQKKWLDPNIGTMFFYSRKEKKKEKEKEG